jgi:predicted Holliday junction resolvase-like endonuclease
MRAATIGIIGLLVLVCTYLYVMALCYLCDHYERKQNSKREAEEKRRKQELQRAIDETELRRRAELERRKRVAEERRQRGYQGQKAGQVSAGS